MPILNNDLQVIIDKTLLWGANLIAETARSLAKTKRIRRSIKVSKILVDGKSRKIIVSVNTRDAPEALAYEFGSGIWGKSGQRYPITPVNKKFLAFEWPEATNIASLEGFTKVNFHPGEAETEREAGSKVILPGVMHPGVEAEPYMGKSLELHLSEIMKEFADKSVIAAADMTVEKLS